MREKIVAEISKNWVDGISPSKLLLATQFENVIEVNRARGYDLYSFQIHRMMTSRHCMNETIIAVFEKI